MLKGILEGVLADVDPTKSFEIGACDLDLLDASRRATLLVDGKKAGVIGEVSDSGRKAFGLRSTTSVAEIELALLEELAVLIPQHVDQSPYPPMSRDFNFIVDNSVHWTELESTIRSSGGELVESINYCETFRDPKKDGDSKKRLLLSIQLRSSTTTLTGEQADEVCGNIIKGCADKHAAVLL